MWELLLCCWGRGSSTRPEAGEVKAVSKPRLSDSTSRQRRWTVADLDDEEFLRQLEIRLSGAGGRLRQSRMLLDFAMGAESTRGPELGDYEDSDTDDNIAEREWVRARRAMMCVREIVRTEKSYLQHLVGFLNNEDASTMSSILAEHLPRLIETSRLFCSKLEEDPSAYGVSRAFVDLQEQLEATFVQWSSAFDEMNSLARQRRESQTHGSAGSTWIRRRSATAGYATPPLSSFRLSLITTPMNGGGSKGHKLTRRINCGKITEQDVIVMPTGRAVRYILMYRELLFHTPSTSASWTHVNDALQCATRIARLCDEKYKPDC